MKKSKGQTIDLFYTNNKETNKKSKKVGAATSRPQKGKNKKTKSKKPNNEDNKIINLDNEIIIGLTPKKEEPQKVNSKKRKTKNVGATSSRSTKNKKTNSKNNQTKNTKIKKKKTKNKIMKWIILFLLLLIAIGLFMMSSVFNIKQIIVVNNSKVEEQEIINLSTLTTGVNMFKVTNETIKNGVKTNPYIENVTVRRNLNGTITLEIQERKPTYMLKFGKSYVYINNQGYMLEISEKPLKLPVIVGFETSQEELKAGNRLVVEDLKKLEDVIKIFESAKSISMDKLINKIDITDSLNYVLTIKSEDKTVQFGDCSNVNVKLLKAQAVIEREKGIAGEIYFQGLEKTIFREKV